MTSDSEGDDLDRLPPNEAFSALGTEARLDILQVLGEAMGPLAFSELYERVDIRDSGQFSYHLDKLLGHFVRKTEQGYDLRQAGQRVVEAILSGAITETALLEPSSLEDPCPYCGTSIEVSYRDERLLQQCPSCPGGVRGGSVPTGTLELGYFPPAGLMDRAPPELVVARNTWSVVEQVAMANDVCPRCAGHVEHSVQWCEAHTDDGICGSCDRRQAVRIDSQCLNCPHDKAGTILRILLGEPDFRAFFERRGIDLFATEPAEGERIVNYDEEILGTDPFEAQFTFTCRGDSIRFTVDDDLTLSAVTRDPDVDGRE